MDSSEGSSLPDLTIEMVPKRRGEDSDYDALEIKLINHMRWKRTRAAVATNEPSEDTLDDTHESIIPEGDDLNELIENIRRLQSPHRFSSIQQVSETTPCTPPAPLLDLRQLSSSTKEISQISPDSLLKSPMLQLTPTTRQSEIEQGTLRRSERLMKISLARLASPATPLQRSPPEPLKKYPRNVKKRSKSGRIRKGSHARPATHTRCHPRTGVFHLIRPKKVDSKATQTEATFIDKILLSTNYQAYGVREKPNTHKTD